jgi:transcriptional regulator with XRE-family HTH domain
MGPLEIAKKPKREVGDLLRDARITYGISQGELATRAGTTQSAISRIEAGKVSPSFETVRELLRLLGGDLHIENRPRDTGVDPTLNEGNLAFSSSERVQRGLGWAEEVLRTQRRNGVGAGGKRKAPAPKEGMNEREAKPLLQAGPLLDALDRKGVDFVVIGGVAGLAHGSAYPTYDLDIAYARGARNLERMAAALRSIGIRLRGAPDDLPFQVEARTLAAGMNFTFDTEFGAFDILGQVDGVRSYEELRAQASIEEIGGIPVRVASLNQLIGMKRTVDRTKDQLMVEEYVAIERLHREWKKRHEAD